MNLEAKPKVFLR
uniref:Uncharacterized protein n=1 Tax=Anguilla anguilla TaxID=7936 RepID=A0A0E9U3B8_ANGAN